MGSLVGHVLPGLAFFLIGLWHLFNNIKLFSLHPNNFTIFPWFPIHNLRYLELFLIMLGSSISMSMELFIGPKNHQPFDPIDGTIPSNHLHNFEHSLIDFSLFTYAVFAVILDKTKPKAHLDLTNLAASVVFVQQLFLFHFHSADHMGIEGRYHMLLQLIIFVSLVTTLIAIALPRSFLVSFVRSLSIASQGIWLMVMGYMVWTPSLVPKGCFPHREEGHIVVRCSSNEDLHRAKALVNILFGWFLVGVTIFAISIYLFLQRIYCEKDEYSKIATLEEMDMTMIGEDHDVELQKGDNSLY